MAMKLMPIKNEAGEEMSTDEIMLFLKSQLEGGSVIGE